MNSPVGKGKDTNRPTFFLSYAHVPRNPRSTVDPNRWVKQLFSDLCDAILQITDEDGSRPIGFMDKSLHQGQKWAERLSWELANCKVFVPLYSPRYFRSEACGREWHAFTQRSVYQRWTTPEKTTGIVPALWVPMEHYRLPQVASELQFNHDSFGAGYASEGLYALMKIATYEAQYSQAVLQLARRIVEVARQTVIPTCQPLDFESLPSAFGPPLPGDRVRISVFSLSHGELPPNRSASYYGPRRIDWQPYHPQSLRPLAEDAVDVARTMGFQASVHEFEDEADTLLTTVQPEAPSVLLVDRWALTDRQRIENLTKVDQKNLTWVSVLEPWNTDDPECRQHERRFDGLSENALRRSRGGPRPSLRDGAGGGGAPSTLEEFRGELVRAVMRANAEFDHKGPPTASAGHSAKPRLR